MGMEGAPQERIDDVEKAEAMATASDFSHTMAGELRKDEDIRFGKDAGHNAATHRASSGYEAGAEADENEAGIEFEARKEIESMSSVGEAIRAVKDAEIRARGLRKALDSIMEKNGW